MAFIDTVKPWFAQLKKPTWQQFYNLFDWLRWKDEPIPMADVTGLIATLNQLAQPLQVFEKNTSANEDFYYLLNQGYRLEAIIVEPIADCTVTINDNTTGTNLLEDEELLAGSMLDITPNISTQEDRGFVFSGLPAKTKITIVKRKIRL